MSSEKVKVKFDEEDLLNDAMAYYKADTFDPTKPLRVLLKGQLAFIMLPC